MVGHRPDDTTRNQRYHLGRVLRVWVADTSSDHFVSVVANHQALRAGRSGTDLMCGGVTVNYQQQVCHFMYNCVLTSTAGDADPGIGYCF
jgi:hypothetical protein